MYIRTYGATHSAGTPKRKHMSVYVYRSERFCEFSKTARNTCCHNGLHASQYFSLFVMWPFQEGLSRARPRVRARRRLVKRVSLLNFLLSPLDTDVSLAYTAAVGGEEPTGRQEGRPAVWPAVREPLMDRDSRHEGGNSPQADPTKAPNDPPPPPTVSRRHRHRTVRITLNRRLITRRHPQARLTSTWLDRRTMARDHTGGLRVWLSEPATSASRSMRTT